MSSPILELTDVTKRYGPTLALSGVSIDLHKGEVHALLGENGAGKSTLVKIMSGTVQPNEGALTVDGVPQRFKAARDAVHAGISTAYQELTIIPELTVAENLTLGNSPRNKVGFVTTAAMVRTATAMMERWGLEGVNAEDSAGDYALGVRQQLELVRALDRNAPVLLLDEPTAALGAEQVRWLFAQVRRACSEGTSTLFISHRMGEVRELCDRVTVLRNGKNVATSMTADVSDDKVVEQMAGESLERALTQDGPERAIGDTVLEVRHLSASPGLRNASFSLRRGEILGVAALQGQGQNELFLSLFGDHKPSSGQILIDGSEVRIPNPGAAVRRGISLVPEDRKSEGVLVNLSGRTNLTLPFLDQFSKLGVLDKRAERVRSREVMRRLNVKPEALHADVSTLSGGNQQKIAIGKWLVGEGEILLLFDPTRGVDVGTKAEIFDLMRELASTGRAILFYSTDIEEIISVADAAIVMYRGEVVDRLASEDLERSKVLRSMLGVDAPVGTGQTMAEG